MACFMFRISGGMVSRILSILISSIFLMGCDAFFEKDLAGDNVILESPANGTVTTLFTHEFSWEKVKGAREYQLQIAYPSFDYIQSFVADTITSANTITITLSPGTYQWRVKAMNSTSKTLYSQPYDLTIDTTSNLTYQQVALTSPANGIVTNQSQVNFSWQALSIADSYEIILKSGSTWSSGTIISTDTLTTNNYTVDSLFEGNYHWGVRAMNSQSYTLNYSIRSFQVDTTSPPVVLLVTPSDNSFQAAGTVSFSWTRPSDTGINPSSLTDSIFVFTDTTLTNLSFKDGIQGTSTTRSLLNTGPYFWYVISFDAAGNFSDTSQIFDFQIQ